MAIIGNFTREGTRFTGSIRTFTFHLAYVTVEPFANKRGEKSPDYRVLCDSSGLGEIGAAWKRTGKTQEYLSVRIDDPTFAAPMDCRLVKTGAEHGYTRNGVAHTCALGRPARSLEISRTVPRVSKGAKLCSSCLPYAISAISDKDCSVRRNERALRRPPLPVLNLSS
jgi:uncharacterized protein (DUF736 family)